MKVYPISYKNFIIREYENFLRENKQPLNTCEVCEFRFGCKKNNGPCEPIGMVYDIKKIEKILIKNNIISESISIKPISLKKLVNLWGGPIKYSTEFNMFVLHTWDSFEKQVDGGCYGMIEKEVIKKKDIPLKDEWILPDKIKKRIPFTLQELATKYNSPIYYDADLELACFREKGIALKYERGPCKGSLNNFYNLFKELPTESGWYMP